MTLPLLVREMLPSERVMVLSDWKRGLRDERPSWGSTLYQDEWWALVNYVVDRISFPSCKVLMVCHAREADVPLGWAAIRDSLIVRIHAKASVRETPELAARLQGFLLGSDTSLRPTRFNPFHELRRAQQGDHR